MNHSDVMGIRNGADVLFRQFFAMFNVYGFYFVGFIVMLAMFVSYYFFSRAPEPYSRFRPAVFVFMIIESGLYALMMYILVQKIGQYYLINGQAASKLSMIALALGAGVYEEFIFRVVMTGGLLFFLKDLVRLQPITATVIAVLVSSAVFAFFHYLGPMGEVFDWTSFTIRLAAGIFLALVFALRGYGITAYTHTIYDFLVILS